MSEVASKKIAILYSEAKREYFPTEEQFITEEEVYKRAKIVAPYFQKLGFETELIPGNQDLVDTLKAKGPFAFVLNLVDSIRGKEYLCPVIPATLELMNIPYVGTGMLGLAINSNKFLTKTLMEQAGLPLPRFQLFSNPTDPIDPHLKFPLISKLNEIHGSVEITREAVSENEAHLRARLKSLMSVYHQPVIVEEFIVGRELTVFLLEGVVKKVYVAEKAFKPSDEKYKMATFEAVWGNEDSYDEVKADGHGLLEQYTRTAFEVLKMDDYAKFDVRLDESGRYYFIDCNANPAFGPLESDCAVSHVLRLYGVDFDEIVRRLTQNVTRVNNEVLVTTV
ncbi:MAG TPA: hypothetical protein VJH75_00525 [Patescibacteria group bacterium]|nr:hypothetical protein [Patescibacteria group bacterium]